MSARLELRAGRASLRMERRAVLTVAGLAAVLLAAVIASIAIGEYDLSPSQVVSALVGGGDSGTRFVVNELRLPRVLVALGAGAALGIAGALLQDLSGNPLVAPDLLGISTGASLAAVAVIVFVDPSSGLGAPAAALAGGLLTGAALYALAWRGGVHGYRLVLVGIALAALLNAGIAYVLTRGGVYEVNQAYVWMVGSLNGRGWEQVWPLLAVLAVAGPAALALCRPLATLQLGDEAARALGVRVERVRLGVLAMAILLTAAAVAAAGPIAFVAFASPHLARRIARTASPVATALAAAATGALVVVLADFAGRFLFLPTEIPVGIVTAILAAPYFLFLLGRASREGLIA